MVEMTNNNRRRCHKKMPATHHSDQKGFTLLEILLALAIAGVLTAALSGFISTALYAEQATRLQNNTLQQARFAMQHLTRAVGKTRRLQIPLAENSATAYSESIRDVLAVSLDPTLDRDKDGWADANNDKDFLDVNKSGSRDAGEPERIDEDFVKDNNMDGRAGITGIDDNGDGNVDGGSANDNDEDGSNFEDVFNGIDDDGDGSIDEDFDKDMNADTKPGISGVDDDYDGSIDEGNSDDDDEDGLRDEDWIDSQVFFLNGTTLMERLPDINPSDGTQYTEYAIAENVSQFRIERVPGGNTSIILVDLTLTLSPSGGEPVSLNTRVGVGSGL
jgi:prepilin-type N-terminal cleavage/methylation domain-containing protein